MPAVPSRGGMTHGQAIDVEAEADLDEDGVFIFDVDHASRLADLPAGEPSRPVIRVPRRGTIALD
jgi:hypothetical protein